MHRLSIARSLRVALIVLTGALVIVAALGVSSLYHSRQRYEDVLVRDSARSTAAANGLAAEVARHPSDAGALRRAQANEVVLQGRLRAEVSAARARARSQSRHAIVLVVVTGALALLGVLSLITLLGRTMRRPLDELVEATHDLATGNLERRVKPAGPRELRVLGSSFNAMGADLAAAHELLEQERQRLEVTIESLGDGLVVTEGQELTIANVNPRAAELVPELKAGEGALAQGSPLPPLEQALEREVTVEHRGRTLAATAARLGIASEGVVWTLRDMSDRVRLERAKSEFVATASHELRSPLTSIKGFVELLERSPGNMSERQKEFVEIILRSTDRLVDLVNDLLDVASIEADRVEINKRPIDVGEAVREVIELMGPRIEEKRQQLGTYLAPTLPLAMADPGRVRQIVANLLTNAHLYTPEGGKIHVGVEADRAWVQLVVADNGVGMDEEERARLFERFYRGADGARTATGTGLGLSIVSRSSRCMTGRSTSSPSRGGEPPFGCCSRPQSRVRSPESRLTLCAAAGCSWSTTSQKSRG
jgi:signal transduction histidine kinase/HAMP domain-containing protein